ncbi:TauD/TfdA family dioxygenase [Altererythrobacter sp. ZODW24]|uniref:TauD/TfdA dioxygenase family protein n=1 Tax=Altererythrobacter sp. ZODW24 TaxID=2185142 RepID=UPI000DF7BBA3|nr:TauD/TfdA family dioxygenase [Altererythrobacter sp. ZODW24]
MAKLEPETALDTGDLNVRPMTPTIGAEILDIDLAHPEIEQRIPEIRAALLKHGVIFFRDQELTAHQHIAFGRHFGELEIHPATPKKQADREILHIAHGPESRGRENMWHSDVTWRPEPSLGSILRAVEVPEVGGDTLFVDMNRAYEMLSPEMQKFCSGLTAVHDIARVFGKRLTMTPEELLIKYPLQSHPVIRTHPETGKQVIYVNRAFTSHIEGLSKTESATLIEHLCATASNPEIQCRFRWEAGSMAFWDNRICQHFAASDYFPAVRKMERVTIAGDKPFYEAGD